MSYLLHIDSQDFTDQLNANSGVFFFVASW